MSSRRSSFKRRDKTPFQRFKEHFRHFIAFMFSNVGIILLVVFYTIGGAFMFQLIETTEFEKLQNTTEYQLEQQAKRNITADCLDKLWSMTATHISLVDHNTFHKKINEILLEYQRNIVNRTLEEYDIEQMWNFSGAFLYSLTVITTIGYGNISPKSNWGKMVTILYAIIGMPLFLLYLSNIGDVLAKSFKWIYSKVCLCRICPGVAKRRILRDRLKLKQMVMSKALNDMENARRSKYSSRHSTNSNSNESSQSDEYSEEGSETSTPSNMTNIQMQQALEEILEEENSDVEREIRTDEITVPLTVCIIIMISYIISGAMLFKGWEKWDYLDGSYFCFISLSSIGFGDLVPGEKLLRSNNAEEINVSFIMCSVYLLLGMALIAMCFNLMQEQVIHNLRAVKRAFKTCFRCRGR